MVKSLITRYNANNSYVGDMNKKHNDIVNEVQAMFPLKAKHQVICLYVDLVVEMTQSSTGNDTCYSAEVSRNVVNNNYEISVKDASMNTMRVAQDVPCGQPAHLMKRSLNGFWTMEEHSEKWKKRRRNRHLIVALFDGVLVVMKLGNLKYFLKQENTTRRQRYNINDIGLYDVEPGVQNNTSGWEGYAFDGGAYNPNNYGASDQHTTMNNLAQVQWPILYHASQANIDSSQTPARASNQKMGATGSSAAPIVEGARGSQAAWASDHLEDFFLDEMLNMDMF
ncbi:hypothetical protein GQ55_7G264400 [Panicum hallii var. hallii]|uniref:HTH 3-helical bundle domain-containing protein n=1 Tax=Panicum hallii var. hallii TaxID=1504633 RepID=A0A2T7CZ92_9POAL|nr:hypothetical protein GQ55_7G264400 [Panicum hallii var. hallii]